MSRAALLCVGFAFGCGFSYLPRNQLGATTTSAPAAPSPACARLNRSAMIATGFAITLGVLAGSSGVAAIVEQSKAVPLYASASIGLALSAGDALAGALATGYGTRYAASCTVNTGNGGAP